MSYGAWFKKWENNKEKDMVKFRRWNTMKKRWEDRDGNLATCPDWAAGCKEYDPLEIHPDDLLGPKAKKEKEKALVLVPEVKEPERRKSVERPGPEEKIAELTPRGFILKPETEFSGRPWEAIDKARWPNTWWFYFTFYHSSKYHTDTKYVSDYSGMTGNTGIYNHSNTKYYPGYKGNYHESD